MTLNKWFRNVGGLNHPVLDPFQSFIHGYYESFSGFGFLFKLPTSVQIRIGSTMIKDTKIRCTMFIVRYKCLD